MLIAVAGGLTACSQSPAVPSVPANVLVVPGNGTAVVHWRQADQGEQVASHIATAQPGGRSCGSRSSTCLLTGLTNGRTYDVSVQSVAAGGRSAAATTTVTPGSPLPPGAVTAVPGDSSATLSWKAPLNAALAPPAEYLVTSEPPGGSCRSPITFCAIPGLTNGVAYSFAVVARNQFGKSTASTAGTSITPSTTAGGSVGIVYLGPVNANPGSTTGATLQRQGGLSVALPKGHDLWIVGNSSSSATTSSQSDALIASSTVVKGRYTPGRAPIFPTASKPAGATAGAKVGGKAGATAGATAPTQLIPTPTNTYIPDGSGRACTPANGALYTTRWPTGAALIDTQTLYVSYTDVCAMSAGFIAVEGWGFMTYGWKNRRILSQPIDVFPPAASGAALSPERAYQSPIVADGKITLFTSQCTSFFLLCLAGTVSTTTISSNVQAMAVPSNYVSHPSVPDASAQWMPVDVSVAAYPGGLRLIEQTSLAGTFVVFSSASPTGPWHPVYSGSLPGCSSTPAGFCSTFVGHPELSTGTSLVLSYFKPDGPGSTGIGYVYLARVPLTGN